MQRSIKLAIFASVLLCAGRAAAQAQPAHLADTRSVSKDAAERPSGLSPQLLFGALPVSTRSREARAMVEKSLVNYENVMMDDAIAQAKKATEIDPQFALAYALWSFASQHTQPAALAVRKASDLASSAPPDEQLLVRWMLATQSSDLLPAISLMNDLLHRLPGNQHVLYLCGEWLYFQQDYDRSRKILEKALQVDPQFAPPLNMLGYAYIETGDPDPIKAKAALQRYSELLPTHPNPHDSLGEVLRFAGDDQGSLVEYRKALQLSPTFYTSQLGLGDTFTLMGDFDQARAEMNKSIPMAPTGRDRLHVALQKALTRFWAGQPELGRSELAALEQQARDENDGYSQYDLGLARAFLAANPADELTHLARLESLFSSPFSDMAEEDRHTALASILREEVRVLCQLGKVQSAGAPIRKLEQLARDTRDAIIEDCYESARGFAFFATADYASAIDNLSSDPQNPLVAWQIVLANQKLGNQPAVEVSRNRWKYLRSNTPQWFLAYQASLK